MYNVFYFLKTLINYRTNAARILARMEEYVFLYMLMIRIIVNAMQTQPGSRKGNTVKPS